MADDEANADDKPKSGMMKSIVISLVVGLVCGGLGFGFATMMPTDDGSEEPVEAEVAAPAFIPFGEVVANLQDGRMTRYLRLSITLQVDGEKEIDATAAVEEKKAILRNWILGYMSDLTLTDINGRTGQNRIRRDTQNQFNDILSPDGTDVVRDILFEEFTIQ